MPLDSAIASLLSIDPALATVSSVGGGDSSASASKIAYKPTDGPVRHFFLKTGTGSDAEIMFAGEHASLSALAAAVPGICPSSYGHGKLADQSNKSFLVTDYLDMSGRGQRGEFSLASKLAKLHTTPAPVPEGYSEQQFGFPVPTCCGDTRQQNEFKSSWADFYANNRLRYITQQSRKRNGADQELEGVVEKICNDVIPHLIGDKHLNDGRGVQAVVVHGDLWNGNAGSGRLSDMTVPEDITYDPSSCYAHSEYDLGIMKMFGGFSGRFMEEYHKHCPKTSPVHQYEDRVALYELYHHLNHYSMFGGGYRSGAMRIMRDLIKKYGTKTEL